MTAIPQAERISGVFKVDLDLLHTIPLYFPDDTGEIGSSYSEGISVARPDGVQHGRNIPFYMLLFSTKGWKVCTQLKTPCCSEISHQHL